ncbi:CoA transferase [Streptomyces sp. NPDC014676]|uniref:CoA transferase n=1 Tax=Streptomyces sp. NPDC014676 TaxID=3364879 RepID=UPI0036F62405
MTGTIISQTTIGGKDCILREITIPSGQSTGWHYHDGTLYGFVREGTLGFATVGLRNDHREELRPELETALATRGVDEWAELLTRAGLPCGPINDVRGGVEMAARLGLEPVVDVEGVPMVRNPVTCPVDYAGERDHPGARRSAAG